VHNTDVLMLAASIIIIIIMLPNQAIASTPLAASKDTITMTVYVWQGAQATIR
jgi:uncharacterized membrane protein YeiH